MKKVIHLQTTLTALFGEVDENGNVVKKTPYNLELPKLDKEVFDGALEALVKVWDEANAAPTEEPKAPTSKKAK